MEYFVLILAVIIGASIAFFSKSNLVLSKKLLMFSGGLLLSITVLDMFPSLYSEGGMNAGIWVLVGVALQLFLENLSKGIEHGHFHFHKNEKNISSIVPLSVMFGIFIHSFLEGMPIKEQSFHNHLHEHSNILWALSVHKISESIVLTTFLFSLNLKKVYSIAIITLFTISAPLGTFLGTFLSPDVYPKVLGIVSGIFLHISSVIIFESNEKHTLNWQKMIFVFGGMLLGFFMSII